VYASSTGSAVSFSAGTKDVFLSLPASKTVRFDDTTGGVTIAGDVGIGTAVPDAKLHVDGGAYINSSTTLPALSASIVAGEIHAGNNNAAITDSGYLRLSAGGGTTVGVKAAIDIFRDGVGAAGIIAYTSGTERLRIDASGNVGLGVTPSAWGSSEAMEFGNAFAYGKRGLTVNAYFDSGSAWKYVTTGASALYQPNAGAHVWYTAPSGTAGNTISFTQAMTLDASGRLGIGVTPSASFDVLSGTDTVGVRIRENASNNGAIQITDNPVTVARVSLSWTNATTTAQLDTTGSLSFSAGGAERGRYKTTGQLRFVPLSADPAGAETGDVYYNSSTNKLRVYNGAWVDLH
jgi:hypothetical protein